MARLATRLERMGIGTQKETVTHWGCRRGQLSPAWPALNNPSSIRLVQTNQTRGPQVPQARRTV